MIVEIDEYGIYWINPSDARREAGSETRENLEKRFSGFAGSYQTVCDSPVEVKQGIQHRFDWLSVFLVTRRVLLRAKCPVCGNYRLAKYGHYRWRRRDRKRFLTRFRSRSWAEHRQFLWDLFWKVRFKSGFDLSLPPPLDNDACIVCERREIKNYCRKEIALCREKAILKKLVPLQRAAGKALWKRDLDALKSLGQEFARLGSSQK